MTRHSRLLITIGPETEDFVQCFIIFTFQLPLVFVNMYCNIYEDEFYKHSTVDRLFCFYYGLSSFVGCLKPEYIFGIVREFFPGKDEWDNNDFTDTSPTIKPTTGEIKSGFIPFIKDICV